VRLRSSPLSETQQLCAVSASRTSRRRQTARAR
jgi:hypothetical protein